MLDAPSAVLASLRLGDLEGIAAEVNELREAQRHERVLPHVQTLGPLLHKQHLPAFIPQGGEVAVVRPVEEVLTGVLRFACEIVHQVIAVEVNLEGLACRVKAGQQLLLDVRLARRRRQGWHPVFVGNDAVDLRCPA